MNIGAILVGIALLVLVGAYVARPLFEGRSSRRNVGATDVGSRTQLVARRDAVYALIRELEADYQTGKVNDEDYRTQRERYYVEGISLLKQLDALSSGNGRAALEAEIEAAVQTLRQKPGLDEDEPAAQFCTQCGYPADPEDRFCGRCGTPLKKETAFQ